MASRGLTHEIGERKVLVRTGRIRPGERKKTCVVYDINRLTLFNASIVALFEILWSSPSTSGVIASIIPGT